MRQHADSASPRRSGKLGSVLLVIFVFFFFLLTTFVLGLYLKGSFQGRPALYLVWLSGGLWAVGVFAGIVGSGLGKFGAAAQWVATALAVGLAIVVAGLVARTVLR